MKAVGFFIGVTLVWCVAAAEQIDLQARIDAAAAAGGGTVTVEKGEWTAKPFLLRSNVTLDLREGAVVSASTNLADYAGMGDGQRYFVFAEGATNVAIVGKGVLDGQGWAFREVRKLPGESQPQKLPVMMRFSRCRNLRLEGFTYRNCGAWGCHLRNCDGVTARGLTCFSHANRTNDGIDIESSNVVVEDCTFDTGDDAVVFKTESDKTFPVTNVVVRNCRIASRCNGVKFGTGSYCDVRDVRIENCTLFRAAPHPGSRSRKEFPGVTVDNAGLAGLALEVVDGGRLEDVTIRNVEMTGFMVPVFIRLGRRRAPLSEKGTYLRNVLIENVKAVADSRIASSITGVPGLRPSDITLRNVEIVSPGGGTKEDAERPVPEMETMYPECTMFHEGFPDFADNTKIALPAYGFYVRHADNVRFENCRVTCAEPDAREPFVTDDVGCRVPCWHPGELDIHFIHTGVGEQTFFVFPDGTTMLLDCGDTHHAKYMKDVPPMPDGSRYGGEWVSRYIRRLIPQREIDYAMVSHWHGDHAGDLDFGGKRTADGRVVCGLPLVGEDFKFRHYLDHQYPKMGEHELDPDPNCLSLMKAWLPRAEARGMKAHRFEVGALNQIRLLHDAAAYPQFEIRNIAANAVIWDGKDGVVDVGLTHAEKTGKDAIHENRLSAAIRIRYGAFSCYTGGDNELTMVGADGREFNWEAMIGRRVGPVDVCKTNHHAGKFGMSPEFVKEVRAQVYLSSVWQARMVDHKSLSAMCSRELYPGERTVCFGAIAESRKDVAAAYGADIAPAGHAVVKVAPGGATFDVYSVDASDESMRVLSRRSFVSGRPAVFCGDKPSKTGGR